MKSPRPACRLVALLGIGVVVLATPTLAQDCPELVGRWPYGPAYAVAASGDYAYFGSGTVLMVADVSNPSAPRTVGEIVLPSSPGDIVVSEGYAYVGAWESGLRVIDVRTPSAPLEVAATPGHLSRIAVAGTYAYVSDWYHLRIIDVSTPSAPAEVGSLDIEGAGAVAVSHDFAYVLAVDGLRVIDVSSPSAPVEVGSLNVANAGAVAVSGDHAYLSGNGLRVIDVSTPTAPMEVGFIDLLGSGVDVAASGGYAYVAYEGDEYTGTGLRVIDVSTPSAPVEVGFIETPGRSNNWIRVAISGGHAYVADDEAGMRVIDVSTPSALVEVGFIDTPGWSSKIAAMAGYVYVSDGDELRILDVSSPSVPVVVGSPSLPCSSGDVDAVGTYAYVTAWGDGLRIIDVSTPSAPVAVGSFSDTSFYAVTVAVMGRYAYVAGPDLWAIDVSTPSAPMGMGSVGTPGDPQDVAVSGDYAYVANYDRGLRVIDVSSPSAPVQASIINTPGRALGVAVAGEHAYVADMDGGLQVFDVSTPSAPTRVGSCDTGRATAVAVSRGYAYVGAQSGLKVVDVRTPAAPVEVGSFAALRGGTDVAVSGGYVFVTAGEAGVYIFRDCAGGMFPDGHESFVPAAAVAAGAQGAFFQTDLELNNTGAEEAQLYLAWLPRGDSNAAPVISDLMSLGTGNSLRWENVLTALFGLGPDSAGALKLVASTESVIGMSRTYNIPAGKAAGTFGQGLPAIRATEMIAGTDPQRIIFMSEDPDSRANVGCVNGSGEAVRINIGIFNAEGSLLETKTMDLGPYSNNQINRVFRDYQPVSGYVDVWANRDDALFYCYGSMLDNLTSDPTTILPQVPSADLTFVPAAALAAGLEGAFFQTDVDLNNTGSTGTTYEFLWLPRGEDNSEPIRSDTFSLAPGAGVRYANVLDEVFGLEPDVVGALAVDASAIDLLAMSRTYNLPSAKVAGTFGQELPGIPADKMIASGVKKRIIFMNENDDVRSNVGCQNGSAETVRVFIELFSTEGETLETKTMDLAPYSNFQITRVFRDYSPVSAGYVDVWTMTPGATVYCYGSVLDNVTSDPTTVLPQ